MKCQILFAEKNKETVISVSFAEFAPREVKANLPEDNAVFFVR